MRLHPYTPGLLTKKWRRFGRETNYVYFDGIVWRDSYKEIVKFTDEDVDANDWEEAREPGQVIPRSGWVNVYTGLRAQPILSVVYATREEAVAHRDGNCVDTVPIAWSEEVRADK